MNRKLWLLNFVLLALAILLGRQLRLNWLDARQREAILLGTVPAPLKAGVYDKKPLVGSITPASYSGVAQYLLFTRDRNPNVELPPPAPPPVPPPAPVMPPLPKAYGYMNLGEPTILLAEKSGAVQKPYHPGDTIGEFKIVSISQQDIVFDWNGTEVQRKLEELKDSQPNINAPPVSSLANNASASENNKVISSASSSTAAQASPQMSTDSNQKQASGPSPDAGGVAHGCLPNDPTPSGTVVSGYRKVDSMTPFGKACTWEPVR